MAPSAGLLSLLADRVTPSFLLEAAGEYLESLDAEIRECELGIRPGVNVDEMKYNDEGEEGEKKVSSHELDDGDEMDKNLQMGAQQQARRKKNEGSHSKKEIEDMLARLRKDRDVMVQDIQWLQNHHSQTLSSSVSSPFPPFSFQCPPSTYSSTCIPTHKPLSLSSNPTTTPLSPLSVSRSAIKPEFQNGNLSITTTTPINTHQNSRRTSKDGAWHRRSKIRGRERVRRPRSAEAELPGGVGLESAVGGKVIEAGEEEEKEQEAIGFAL